MILVKILGAIICTKYFKIKTPNFVHTVGVLASHDFLQLTDFFSLKQPIIL